MSSLPRIVPTIACDEGSCGISLWAGKLRDVLHQSVESCIGENKEVGVFLSGGLDSSSVAALAYEYLGVGLHAFSVGFESFSELEYARRVVKHLGLGQTHHEIMISADMVARDILEIAKEFDEPMGDAAGINNYYLAREAQKYVKVVLTGDGGDEVIGGYPWYTIGLRFAKVFGLPLLVKEIERLILSMVPHKGNLNTSGNRFHWLSSVFCEPTILDAQLYMESAITPTELDWMSRLGWQRANDSFTMPPKMRSLINRMQALDCLNLLPEKFFMRTYGATKNSGIEERLPLASLDVVEFAFAMPSELKIKNGQVKFILREAMRDLLPIEILGRKKQGFGTPLVYWFKHPILRDIIVDRLGSGELVRRYFRGDAIKTIVKDLMDGKVNSYHVANAIWTVFALQLWYDSVVLRKR
jgi:asparagine synthase (glutamine-hydrolysing)